MKRCLAAHLLAIALAGGAVADTGGTDSTVLARMEAMKSMAAEVKALTAIARGDAAFDAGEVAARMETIAARAGEVPALFETPGQDPQSGALPAIWVSYPEFTRRAAALVEAARAGAGAADEFELETALAAVGQTCRSCHGTFKAEP